MRYILIILFLFSGLLFADTKYRVNTSTGHREFLSLSDAQKYCQQVGCTSIDTIQFTNIQFLADSIYKADSTINAQKSAVFQNIKTTAQSAVGVSYGSLTAAQVRALLAILLWKEDAFTKTGTVDSLKNWAK